MRLRLTASTLCVALAATLAGAQNAASRHLSRSALEDKIRGGWAGQMIGVSYGAPTEFRSNGKIIEGNLNKWDKADVCVGGALDPFNIDAKLNGGRAPHQISQPGISPPQS